MSTLFMAIAFIYYHPACSESVQANKFLNYVYILSQIHLIPNITTQPLIYGTSRPTKLRINVAINHSCRV